MQEGEGVYEGGGGGGGGERETHTVVCVRVCKISKQSITWE